MTGHSFELVITAVPEGEAPLWVREKWVGLALPLDQRGSSPQTFLGAGVVTGPRTFIGSVIGLLTGRYGRHRGYAVASKPAIELLERSSPDAAVWWKQNAPQFLMAKRYFVFREQDGQVRAAQLAS